MTQAYCIFSVVINANIGQLVGDQGAGSAFSIPVIPEVILGLILHLST